MAKIWESLVGSSCHIYTHTHFKKLRKTVASLLEKVNENVLELSEKLWSCWGFCQRGGRSGQLLHLDAAAV